MLITARVALLLVSLLAGCSRLDEHSVCYVFAWNAHIQCWPEPEPATTRR
jgi:hypothetical protein